MPSHRNLQNHTVAVTGASWGSAPPFARAPRRARLLRGWGFLLKIGKKPGCCCAQCSQRWSAM